MPKDFLIDGNGNKVIRNGDFVFIEGADFIKQTIFIRLRMFLGEYFLDNTKGIDFRNTIYDDPPRMSEFAEQCKSVITDSWGVNQLIDFAITYENDESQPNKGRTIVKVSFIVDTVEGTISGSEPFSA